MSKIDELSLKAMVKLGNLKSKLRREDGASAVEYALIVGLIALVLVGVMTTFGGDLAAKFTEASDALNP